MPLARPCVACSTPTTTTRCPACEQRHQAERNASRPQYRGDWPAQSRSAIAAYRAGHGDVCPGYGRAPHAIAASEWTCDHDRGPLCRPCNGRKGGGDDKRR